MAWPTAADYFDAIQNPQVNLRDSTLKRSVVKTAALGLPEVASGNYASVFQLIEGSQRWAVKCFTRNIPDQQLRYAAISQHLKSHPLNSAVAFDYLREGILIRGAWYPVLRMQWVEGPLLDAYVQRHLSDKNALIDLALKWHECVAGLRRAGVAHGDLQFGNVKVVGGNIRLIDYDGMFVPALKSRASNEQGHPNFQHPGRTGRDFDLYIDHFPSWVIYASLIALSEQPSLWREFDGGDDCLIFRKSDFEKPEASRLLAKLEASGSRNLKAIASRLKAYAGQPVATVPPLDIQTVSAGSRIPNPTTKARPDWMPPVIADTGRGDVPVGQRPTISGNEVSTSRDIMGFAIILAIASLFVGVTSAVPWPLLVCFVAAFLSGATLLVDRQYERFRERIGATEVDRQLKKLGNEITALDTEQRLLESQIQEVGRRAQNVDLALALHASRVERETEQWEKRLSDTRRNFDQVIGAAESRASQSLAELETGVRARLTTLRYQLAHLGQQREAQFRESLEAARVMFIENDMRSWEIRDVRFEGLGETLVARLRDAGIVTALDVLLGSPRGVGGIGTAHAYALKEWARGVRARAEQQAPRELPISMRQSIESEYAERRRRIDLDIAEQQKRLSESANAIHSALAAERRGTEQQRRLAELILGRERDEWAARIGKDGQDLASLQQRIQQEYQKTIGGLMHEQRRLDQQREIALKRRAELVRKGGGFSELSFGSFLSEVFRLKSR